jgi:hypothetical protein
VKTLQPRSLVLAVLAAVVLVGALVPLLLVDLAGGVEALGWVALIVAAALALATAASI